MGKKKKSKKLTEQQVKKGCQIYIFIMISLISTYFLIDWYYKNAEIFWLPAMFLFIGLMGLLATFFPNSLLGISMNTQGSGERFCLHCFKKISSWATTCPYCHKKQHSST